MPALDLLLERVRLDPAADAVAPDSMRAVVVAQSALAAPGGTLLVVTANSREAEVLVEELGSFLDSEQIAFLPSWETLPHERLSPRSDTIGLRVAVLRRLHLGGLRVVVAPTQALVQPIARGIGALEPVTLATGEAAAFDDLPERLVGVGYERVDLVEKRGHFAVRGGIVDVFPPTEEHPLRVEFFGDEVESIRRFAVADQRTLPGEPVTRVEVVACREDLGEGRELLVDLLPEGAQVLVVDPERVRTRAHDLISTDAEFAQAAWSAAAEGGKAPLAPTDETSFRELADVRAQALARGLAWRSISPFGLEEEGGYAPAPAYRGDTDAVLNDVQKWAAEGREVVLVAPAQGVADRMRETFGVPVLLGALTHGFVGPDLVVLTGQDITGAKGAAADRTRMPTRRKKQIDPLELQPGDYVVHEQHGVGRFVEMRQREVAGATREYLVIEYGASKRGAPPDRLYVPADALDQVTRYVGGEQPSLDRLGGADWAKRKGRAKKAVREIAAELIKLYAARQATTGHAFGPDTPWQRELEDAFAYAETADQLTTVDEVKADMEREMPMDRLICGDVGYGKTEIAVRAAFKAVQDGKQVAVLVPTTLLVTQHLATFTERMAGFPVTVKGLSRFQTDKEATAVLEQLSTGQIDIVVGTHRLLGNEVRFKDLGLIIVDEEQRFGVEHKEQMKRLRTSVDVLAMSATPIPRTLEMAITGIREMSTITTPPEERHPVLTYVGGYEEKTVIAAIRRELLRDGQVFYIHNRVESIERAARRLNELVPEARIAVAHGQMNERQLEQVMLDFWEKRFDVLVCTTLVESGLDVSNANTMVIERADMLGLSQLHQLRGRVGRSRERAYAYFLYPPEKPLTETAHERLATLAQHSDLGGGMAIAMKDLEIRGAGNLLGGEQSGHIADVGFDLYVRLVGEAVAEFKAGPDAVEQQSAEIRIELPVDAHLPHSYIPSERLRLEMYKRLAEVQADSDVDSVQEELRDRYGELPVEVLSLLVVARFRARLRQLGVHEATISGKYVRFAPVELPDSRQVRLNRLHPGSLFKAPTRTLLVPRPVVGAVGGRPLDGIGLLEWARQVVDAVVAPDPAPAA